MRAFFFISFSLFSYCLFLSFSILFIDVFSLLHYYIEFVAFLPHCPVPSDYCHYFHYWLEPYFAFLWAVSCHCCLLPPPPPSFPASPSLLPPTEAFFHYFEPLSPFSSLFIHITLLYRALLSFLFLIFSHIGHFLAPLIELIIWEGSLWMAFHNRYIRLLSFLKEDRCLSLSVSQEE